MVGGICGSIHKTQEDDIIGILLQIISVSPSHHVVSSFNSYRLYCMLDCVVTPLIERRLWPLIVRNLCVVNVDILLVRTTLGPNNRQISASIFEGWYR